jgi:hypothetical protein
MNKVIVSFDYNDSILDYNRDLIKKQLIQIQQKYKKFIDPVKFLVFDTNFTHRILHDKIRKQFEKDSRVKLIKTTNEYKEISSLIKDEKIYNSLKEFEGILVYRFDGHIEEIIYILDELNKLNFCIFCNPENISNLVVYKSNSLDANFIYIKVNTE